ncbi:hypothetical protein [Pseudomonas frederiksbergensis]|uniref:Uncharacterized protein n=1 Tax=Pseudomonas frederiksbergensis TaxID=104087 RepID=A0A6L5BQ23_9PSED|nr:hypothetical protein [Pseudomonas frederiksbergensis]KAF2390345.1 hypothetical protein FX983_04806 [Pseudomonas frederiksbergensis]
MTEETFKEGPIRQIIVPLSLVALQRLDLDQNQPGDLETWTLSAEQYQHLWDSGLIQRLNSVLGSLIDDHEDASIQGAAALESAQTLLEQSALSARLKLRFTQLTILARSKATGLFFYF